MFVGRINFVRFVLTVWLNNYYSSLLCYSLVVCSHGYVILILGSFDAQTLHLNWM